MIFARLIFICLMGCLSATYGSVEQALPSNNESSRFIYHSVNVITGEYVEAENDLNIEGPFSLTLRRTYTAEQSPWKFNLPYFFPHNHTPNQTKNEQGAIAYAYDSNQRLIEARGINRDNTDASCWFKFHYFQPDSPDCRIETSDGSQVTYRYQATEQKRREYLLEEVEKTQGPTIRYAYCNHPTEKRRLISRRDVSSGHFTINDYYQPEDFPQKNSPFCGRIKLQYEPLGSDATPVISHRFIYHSDHTEEYNALGIKTIYRYSPEGIITAIEQFRKGEDGSDIFYRAERLHRIANKNGLSLLVSHYYENENREILQCRYYDYDDKGNIIKSTLYGNLTGTCTAPIVLNELSAPIQNGIESYSTSYKYSEGNHSKLLAEIDDNGKTTSYIYDNGLLVAKLVGSHSKISLRQFFFYNPQGFLLQQITDDGGSENPNDTSHVSERRISTYQYNSGIINPSAIEEWREDPASQQKQRLSLTSFCYNAQNKLTQTDRYDGEGAYLSSEYYSYDNAGRLATSSDNRGNIVQYVHDCNGHITSRSELSCEGSYRVVNTLHDLANRPISIEDASNNSEQSTRYRYDFVGNAIASIDSLGNETQYKYDEFNRKISVTYPFVMDANGAPAQPTENFTYDIFNRITAKTDAKGYTTRYVYNVRGDPIAIYHPDGTEESFVYALDGSLVISKDRVGWAMRYAYDDQGRVVIKERIAPLGSSKGTMRFTYNGFQETSSQDEQGFLIHYSYDYQGRITQESRTTENGILLTDYEYDGANKVAVEKSWHESDPSNFLLRRHSYNYLGDPLEVVIEDSQGNIVKVIPIAEPKAEKSIHIEMTETFNDLQQTVMQTIETESSGISKITTHDALGRIATVQTKNSMGTILSQISYRWDLNGNKTQETHLLITPEGYAKDMTTSWSYGPGNRVEAMSRLVEGGRELSTSYIYNKSGQHVASTFPNGITIYYDYDEEGQLTLQYSSDHSICYKYHYDNCGRLHHVEDCLAETAITRNYTHSGRILEESLGDDLCLRYSYDQYGRRSFCRLPDGSGIAYEYDSVFLRTIHRVDAEGNIVYSHRFSSYDANGRLTSSQMIGDCGTLSYSYDSSSHIQTINSPYWSEEVLAIEEGNVYQVVQQNVEDSAGLRTTLVNYDEQHRLVTEASDHINEFTYDSIGNRMSHSANPYNYDDDNLLTSQGDVTYHYDANGNMIEKISPSARWRFHYDALNRLASIEDKDKLRIQFTYDALNRRLSKTVSVWNAFRQRWDKQHRLRFLFDGNREIGAIDDDGSITQLRVLGEGLGAEIGAAVAIEINQMVYAPIHDHRGSVCCMIDLSTQAPAETYRYTSFGNEHIYDAFGNDSEYTSIQNPWRFSSKRIEDECGLIDFGGRFYDSQIGRWITPDPLGMIDGPNRYAYLANNPLGHVDPWGYFSFKAAMGNLWSVAVKQFENAKNFFKKATEFIQNQLSYFQYIKEDVQELGENVFGSLNMILLGFHNDKPEVGCVGSGELNDKLRVTLVHGILNVRDTYLDAANSVSSFIGGHNVHYIAGPTEGWTLDIMKAVAGKMGYLSPLGIQLAETWKKLIEEMGGVDSGGVIIHFAHSNGGSQTRAAAELLTPEEQKMIRIIAVGSATVFPINGFQNAVNFVSYRDIVLYLDPIGYVRGALQDGNVTYLGTPWGIPFVDHLFNSPTYLAILKQIGSKIYSHYGPRTDKMPEIIPAN